MTGPGHSPSSSWVQSAHRREGSATQALQFPAGHPGLSPSNPGIVSAGSYADQSPNYFGIKVENTGIPPTSSPGPHAQKGWGSLPHPQSSLPSPKLQLYPQNPVSENLVNLLKTESETDKRRRESVIQHRSSLSGSQAPVGRGLPSHTPEIEDPGVDNPQDRHFAGPGSRRKLSSSHVSASASHPSSTSGEFWISSDRCAELFQTSQQQTLLLDVRPYAHYVQGSIKGSLNLCIPTTLLKRRSFGTQKLEGTFTDDADKQNFARWRECSAIIVYDSSTTDVKDAVPLLNVLSKFQAEEWQGRGLILRGGFKDFANRFPHLTQQPSPQPQAAPSNQGTSPTSLNVRSVAPVVGGCALPDSSSAVTPFFGNIRQNMDLLGGVGQVPLRQPDHLTEEKRRSLPAWLQDASDPKDQGRLVSERFLDLEKRELERMKSALSYDGSSSSTGDPPKKYRVAGIEKGTKNRYNDIYPFDHSRVRLEGIPSGSCDYVNANHIKAEFSNRRYIATQAPVPDTFNDFWRVVWEQDVRLLVSLTAEVERGQVKCHPYWESGDYGPFKVKAYSERHIHVESKDRPVHSAEAVPSSRDDETNENPVIIVRHFSLCHTAFPFQPLRDITQLQYPYWPDFGTPSQPTHLLELIEQCNKVVRATSSPSWNRDEADPNGQRPVLVHCSAGCGRTGTFCTVDSVLDMLKRQRAEDHDNSSGNRWTGDRTLDLIAKTVADFRKQRPSMVQNLSQFVLCYESVLEWVVSQGSTS
ncbi:hypothetical protein N7510_010212 [Penicillium lagena]|uniref:uncharacterized protein n=1 Tax=Penicillium lagena TaxID=94218 RepID=UPI00253F9364|nr:uncharacterized protein N7510_010212 [Penicillium lagena]KAJ5605058.1 hypothetical protein N7510_010212 [Penicillium lagena]